MPLIYLPYGYPWFREDSHWERREGPEPAARVHLALLARPALLEWVGVLSCLRTSRPSGAEQARLALLIVRGVLMGSVDGQVVLVTGGGSGIGRAVVARFIEEGARVGIMERFADRGDALRTQFGAAVLPVVGDVGKMADNRRAVAETVKAFGKLDVFVGNAGIFDVYARIAELADDELARAYDELFGVNVKGCIFGAMAALPSLRQTSGSIIFTASVAGLNSGGGGALYTASKHAVVGLIRELAVELGPEIRVNGVAPGGTMTDLRGLATLGTDDRSQFAEPTIEDRLRGGNPLRRALVPEDLAGAYVLLASRRDAAGITGTIVTVDAGAMLRMPRQR